MDEQEEGPGNEIDRGEQNRWRRHVSVGGRRGVAHRRLRTLLDFRANATEPMATTQNLLH